MKGMHFVSKRRPGKPIRWYVYAWRGGPLVAKREGGAKPGLTAEELGAVLEALDRTKKADPRTLLSLIHRWRRSPEWANLAPATQANWNIYLNLIDDKWGSTPLSVWSDPRMVSKVVKWRDSRAATPRSADVGVMVLKHLLKFGRLHGKVTINVAEGIPQLYRGSSRAEIIWTDEEIERFAAKAVEFQRPHVTDGLRLAALTGLRRQDLVTLTWSQIQEFALVKKALKRSRGKRFTVIMPRIPLLDELIEELRTRPRQEGVETVLVNSMGRPWSGGGFGGSFNRIRDAAGIVHIDTETGESKRKHLHDVRGTFCSKLILAASAAGQPLTDQEVADLMGWSAEQVAGIRRTYVDQAQVVVAIGERIRGAL